MHGYEVQELIGKDARIFSLPERRGGECDNPEPMMSWKREGVNVRKDGSTFPVHLTSDAVTDNSIGCCTGIVTTCEDISDKKRIEDELQESRQFLENIIQFFPDAIMVIDNAGKVVAWNRAMESLTGTGAEEMVGKGEYEYALPFYNERRPILIDLVLRSDTEVVRKYLSLEQRGETLCAETFMPVSGRYLQGTAAVLRDSGGVVIGAIESIRDVTKRRQMEEALRSANEFSRVVMDSVDDAISIINVDDYRIEGVNAGFLKQLNLTPDEVLGRKCYEVSHHRCEPCAPPFDPCPMQESVVTGKPATAEHVHFLPNGEKLQVEVISSPVFEEGNRVTRVVHVSRNITERKRMEAERERLIEELRDALNKVKTLSGMLPICACCKKIRDDKGYWNQLEAYIGQHSEVLFTHSYCPDCLKKVYAELEVMKANKSAVPTDGKAPDDSGKVSH
jgi:PAS domain S-box-containing protein